VRVYVTDAANPQKYSTITPGVATDVSQSGVGLWMPVPMRINDLIRLELDGKAESPSPLLSVALYGGDVMKTQAYRIVRCQLMPGGLYAVGARKVSA